MKQHLVFGNWNLARMDSLLGFENAPEWLNAE
jgi:hypothetical protein